MIKQLIIAIIFTFITSNIYAQRDVDSLYCDLEADSVGLSKEALKYAFNGYQSLLKSGLVSKKDTIVICDFSQPSNQKRFYIIDLLNAEFIFNTYVAHGAKSGKETAGSFSNKVNSHKSSLGFYVTEGTYYGKNGLSLRIKGLEKGFNNNAEKRGVVVHGSSYVGEDYLEDNAILGRSWGCPAVPESESEDIISLIKGGTCFFIYFPSKLYLLKSKIISNKKL
jgi:hypothetical protein